MAQQQYGYGYGYQAYNYGQPAAAQAAVPQNQTYGGYSNTAATNRSSYGQQNQSSVPPPQQQQQQQQPNVGYSSYQGSQPAPAPAPSGGGGYRQQPQQQQQQQQQQHGSHSSQHLGGAGGGNVASSYGTAAPSYGGASYNTAGSSYGGNTNSSYYSNTSSNTGAASSNPYKASPYAAYQNQAKAGHTSMTSSTPANSSVGNKANKNQAATPYSGAVAYSAASAYTAPTSTTPSGGVAQVVGYPAPSYQANTYSTNSYYKQVKENKNASAAAVPVPPMVGTAVAYPSSYSGVATTAPSNLTPVQQQVVQQYINQKTHPGGTQKYGKPKKLYTPPANPQAFYCDVCKISAASALTYKTHLEGKTHKKKLAQQKITTNTAVTSSTLYCELCEVMCSSKDGLEAHLRGAKHNKVVNLHKKLGKPIPSVKVTTTTSSDGTKSSKITGPKITFVGGSHLNTSTPTSSSAEDGVIKIYPSSAAVPTTTTRDSATDKDTAAETQETNTEDQDEPEPELVGEHLVVPVSGDAKFPHATLKCEMCECFFNDEFAKKLHVKGRRHRLNYKKMYDPKLYVEPTKAMKKEIEKKKKQREMINELRRTATRARRGRGGVRGGITRGGFEGNFSSFEEDGGGWTGPPMHEMRRPEPMDRGHKAMPRNPRDDKLVLRKHTSIYPSEEEVKAVNAVVIDTEKALKIISDDLLKEKCQAESSKDESKRDLKGVMRVGAFARGLLLKGECEVDLVLMTASKPDGALFIHLSNQLPAKFETMKKEGTIENIYNVSANVDKASLIVIAQVNDYRVQATVTLTSASMRDDPTAEQSKADEEQGVLDRQSCLAALAALRHTKWFQAMAHTLPSCVLLMRVLKDISQRIPAWGVLDSWILQLLVQKCIVTANSDFTKPGDVFRRVMECVASGLFLPTGPGLSDPCEKGLVDAAAGLTAQDRANLTLSAQHALRLIAFGKLHLVLGVEPLDGDTEKESTSAQDTGGLGTKRDVEDPADEDREVKKRKIQT